jgi:hypothetical protein
MLNPFRQALTTWKYGKPVVVVSGLPRSGTSLLMNMLEAGGMALLVDNARSADKDNPNGYFELEKVKNLGEMTDKSWVREARGKTVKVISHLLKELPDENYYRVLFARRDLAEVITSQNIMLDRQQAPNPVDDEKAMDLFRKHLINVRVLARCRPNFEMIELPYRDTLHNPPATAKRIARFLRVSLDTGKMSTVVDRRLYRNRETELP